MIKVTTDHNNVSVEFDFSRRIGETTFRVAAPENKYSHSFVSHETSPPAKRDNLRRHLRNSPEWNKKYII